MQHLIELLTNPWIFTLLVILFLGEYIPFTKSLWSYIGVKTQSFGEWFIGSYEKRLYSKKELKIENRRVRLKLKNFFARVFFFALSTVVILILEIVWELGFKGIRRSIERSKMAIWAEEKIKTLPNWAVLVLFSLPFILMELLGIFALAAVVSGQVYLGIIMYVVKVLLFIPVHFILHVGESQLTAIAWFKRRYDILVSIVSWFRRSQTHVKAHNILKTIKAYVSAIKEMFKDIITLQKKAFEQSDVLSPECAKVREEILELQKVDKNVDATYKKFFDCVNDHLSKPIKKEEK